MRKIIVLVFITLILFACGEDKNEAAPSASKQVSPKAENILEIREKLFVEQINDIYLNPEDYVGKTIRYEGIYNEYKDPSAVNPFCSVFRYGPGCCGNDGYVGFEVNWNGTAPEVNDWVEVTGIIESKIIEGWDVVYLRVQSLIVKAERGLETVLQ